MNNDISVNVGTTNNLPSMEMSLDTFIAKQVMDADALVTNASADDLSGYETFYRLCARDVAFRMAIKLKDQQTNSNNAAIDYLRSVTEFELKKAELQEKIQTIENANEKHQAEILKIRAETKKIESETN